MRKYANEIQKAISLAVSEGIPCKYRNGIIVLENSGNEINLCIEHRKDYKFVRWFWLDEWENEIDIATAFVQSPFYADYPDISTAVYETAIFAIRKINTTF